MNPSQRNLLYNREGLPASPFRTDDWPLFDPAAEPIEVAKPEAPSGYQAVDWMRPEMTQASGRSADLSAAPTDGAAAGVGRPFGEFVHGGKAAPPGQIDAQIKQVKQLSVQGKNVTEPDDFPQSKMAARRKRTTFP